MFGYRLWELETGRVEKPNINRPIFPWVKIHGFFTHWDFYRIAKECLPLRTYSVNVLDRILSIVHKHHLLGHWEYLVNGIRGRNIVKKGDGEGSTFLRKILEHKEKIRNGEK